MTQLEIAMELEMINAADYPELVCRLEGLSLSLGAIIKSRSTTNAQSQRTNA